MIHDLIPATSFSRTTSAMRATLATWVQPYPSYLPDFLVSSILPRMLDATGASISLLSLLIVKKA